MVALVEPHHTARAAAHGEVDDVDARVALRDLGRLTHVATQRGDDQLVESTVRHHAHVPRAAATTAFAAAAAPALSKDNLIRG